MKFTSRFMVYFILFKVFVRVLNNLPAVLGFSKGYLLEFRFRYVSDSQRVHGCIFRLKFRFSLRFKIKECNL